MATARLERTELHWKLSPERAALLVRDDERGFALIGRWAGGGALIGSEPERVAVAEDDPLSLMSDQPAVEGMPGELGAVGGGWFGYLGYAVGRRVERLDPGPPRPRLLPDFALAFYDHLLRLDDQGRWWFECLWTPSRSYALAERLALLRGRAEDDPRSRPFATGPWRTTPGPAGHELAVAACRERVHQGDLFQANVGLRLSSRLRGDPADLFAAGVRALRPDRAALVCGPWGAVASLSPELFLERHGRRVRSAPIKGTRPRPADPVGAERERRRLAGAQKDRAENTMIVDLVRNDLGRVCRPGSIEVPALAEPRAHAGVWHLVSEVTGELAEGATDADLLRAAFPPGSVTGAPKIAALNAIAELESTGRETYTGAIGFASPLAGMELSVAIRTFEVRGGKAWLGVGGGVVADSEPTAEARECMVKAAPLLAAIGAETVGPRGERAAAPAPLRIGPRPVPRPDPAAGVFETLLVRDGAPEQLTAHLARMAASVGALYGTALPDGLGDKATAAAAATRGPARMRVDCVPDGGGLRTAVVVTPLCAPRPPVVLAAVTVPGGLGAHKWIDRRLLDALARVTTPALPLLCDLDGLVLESVRSNVFAIERSGDLVPPPLDGRILSGVTRAAVIARAGAEGRTVREEPLSLDRLREAGKAFTTGSLGGVEAVTSLDGVRLARPVPGSDG
ncbi:MAG: aminodeoxychorismate synthase component I [Thermoleophilaceae bacterium]